MASKRWLWIPGLSVLALAGAGLWASGGAVEYARIAVGYGAKQTCSCVFVSGRSLESCTAEFPAEARNAVAIRQDADAIHASIAGGLFSASAVHEEGFGCQLVR